MTPEQMREAIAQRLEKEADDLLRLGYFDARMNLLTAAHIARSVEVQA